jgi:DNA-binding IscR family transcriptional regulator
MTGEFAIATHALVYLHHVGRTASSEELADNICTNAARVRKVMAPLVRVGLVVSHAGAEGGYLLGRDADSITLRDVADALGATIVARGWRSGDVDRDCLVSSGMAGYLDDLCAHLDEACRRELEETSIGDVSRTLETRWESCAPQVRDPSDGTTAS